MDYYVYIYLDPRKSGKYCYDNICFLYEPIYIGKGKYDRIYKNHSHNKYLKRKIDIINKLGSKLIKNKLLDNISENLAFEYEIKYIKEIGRYDLKKGFLTNNTNGGEGVKSFFHNEKTKKILSENFKGSKNPFYGKHHTRKTKKILSEKNKIPYLNIKLYIEKFKYKLLTSKEDYIDVTHHVKLLCPNKHEYNVTFSNFKSGTRCPICFNDRYKLKYSYIKSYIEKFNYQLLTKEKNYENTLNYLCIKCPNINHSEYRVKFNDFRLGYRCRMCYNEKIRGDGSPKAKLISQNVIEIKLLLKSKKLTIKEISEIFGVNNKTISGIKNNISWKHIIII